jgi:hypothetical protein
MPVVVRVLVLLNAASNGATYISTPLMLTWGVSDYEGNERYEMSLQFPNEDYAKDDTTNFMNNMIEFREQRLRLMPLLMLRSGSVRLR